MHKNYQPETKKLLCRACWCFLSASP